jgi:hypothetical protein
MSRIYIRQHDFVVSLWRDSEPGRANFLLTPATTTYTFNDKLKPIEFIVGWDPGLETFFAQAFKTRQCNEKNDPNWTIGNTPKLLQDVDDLRKAIQRSAPEFIWPAILEDWLIDDVMNEGRTRERRSPLLNAFLDALEEQIDFLEDKLDYDERPDELE